jgi:hypothetical protein
MKLKHAQLRARDHASKVPEIAKCGQRMSKDIMQSNSQMQFHIPDDKIILNLSGTVAQSPFSGASALGRV